MLAVGNRTLDKAQRLVERFLAARRWPGVALRASSYHELEGVAFDLVINATSASLSDTVPDLPSGAFAVGSLAYDMMYGKGLTAFLRLAQREGAARLVDGLGMLVEQAAESFFIWRGIRPETRPVIEQLKAL